MFVKALFDSGAWMSNRDGFMARNPSSSKSIVAREISNDQETFLAILHCVLILLDSIGLRCESCLSMTYSMQG
jgi:hypothetical protein